MLDLNIASISSDLSLQAMILPICELVIVPLSVNFDVQVSCIEVDVAVLRVCMYILVHERYVLKIPNQCNRSCKL